MSVSCAFHSASDLITLPITLNFLFKRIVCPKHNLFNADSVDVVDLRDIVGPQPSPLGPALFRVNAVLPAQNTSYEDALPELRERLPDARLVDDAVLWGFPAGPQVPPGAYRARLTMGDWTDTVDVEVVQDPRADHPVADLEARYELATSVYEELNRSHDALRRLRAVRECRIGWRTRPWRRRARS